MLSLWVWALFAGALLLLFWAVGAYARLNQLRTAATRARALLDPLLLQRAERFGRRAADRGTDPELGSSDGCAAAGEPADGGVGAGAGAGDADPAVMPEALASTEARLASTEARLASTEARLASTEARLALTGQDYNDKADAFNNALSEWPTVWLARQVGMKALAPWSDGPLAEPDPAARVAEAGSNGA